jgi:hypothetical protein
MLKAKGRTETSKPTEIAVVCRTMSHYVAPKKMPAFGESRTSGWRNQGGASVDALG